MAKGKRAGIRKQIGDWEWNSTILWTKIIQTGADDCWAWLGSRGPQTNLFGGRKSGEAQMTQARRLLYMDVFNESADDLQIKHSCGNPYCMNWQHFVLKPNQRRFYLDGTERGTKVKPDKTEKLVRAQLVPVKQQRWWQV